MITLELAQTMSIADIDKELIDMSNRIDMAKDEIREIRAVRDQRVTLINIREKLTSEELEALGV